MLSTKYENYLIDLKHYASHASICVFSIFADYYQVKPYGILKICVYISVFTVFKRFDKTMPIHNPVVEMVLFLI